MVRLFILLVFVAGLSGTLGLWIGLMYAPAQGEETRKKLSTVFEEHEGTLDDFLSRGREALGDAVDAISSSENHKDES